MMGESGGVMDWTKVPNGLKERYTSISNISYGLLKMAMLEEININPMPVSPGGDSKSYEVFSSEFNAIMLVAHFYENLMYFEDKRLELEGNNDFQITIPDFYFQHPSLNARLSTGYKESSIISDVVRKTKQKLNYSKDQSFVLSQLHKLEFISVFSHLEAYVESLLVEFVGLERKRAAAKVRKSSLPDLMTEVLNSINPMIIEVINYLDKDALRFIRFCHKLRNLHTHNLGIVNDYFYSECINDGYFVHDVCSETEEPVLEYSRMNFEYFDYVFKVGKVVNLSSMLQPFRLFSREIVFITEAFCGSGGD